MNKTTIPLLILVFRCPNTIKEFNLSQWDLLIRQARHAGVLARLGFFLEKNGIISLVPEKPFNHIQAALTYSRHFGLSLSWEVDCINDALKPLDTSVIYLKGAAYALAGNIAAQGRVSVDVDILVKKDQLDLVEKRLIFKGWRNQKLDAYDQKYYRQWMHELPPMFHLERKTSIDVHHNILPTTSRLRPDANKLLANIVKIPGKDVWVLAPEDRVLHSATHSFHEGEFAQGFRDLSDLDLLLKEFSTQENFWVELLQRAEELNQQITLYYALRYTHQILQTPIPEKVLKASEQQSPNRINIKLMDALFLRALVPDHESCNDYWTGLARWLLFVRSHWLKMPVYLMVPHLIRKAFRRVMGKEQH